MWILPKQLHTSAFVQDTKESGLDLEEFCRTCEKSLSWRGKDSLSRTWLQRWKRENWMRHLSSRTLNNSLTESFVDKWTSYLADSRANPSVVQDNVKQLMTLDTCSHTSEMESGTANLELFFSKMLEESSQPRRGTENQFSNMSSENWKEWVTEQRQEYSQRLKSAPHTKESGCSSWATPEAANQVGYQVSNGKKFPRLGSQVKQWPTVAASEARLGYQRRETGKKGTQKSLTTVVIENGRHALENSNKSLKNHALNPNWVEQLMGLPVGWTDLDFLVTE